MKTSGMKLFSKRIDDIFEQGNPTKAQILDAYNKGLKIDQLEFHNQAVKDCAESATASMIQETANGGKKAVVDKESILKNLKL